MDNKDIPKGWGELKPGEIIRAGDKWKRPGANWKNVNSTGGRWNAIDFWPCIRKEKDKEK